MAIGCFRNSAGAEAVVADVEKKMKQASEELHFEQAARMRDRLQAKSIVFAALYSLTQTSPNEPRMCQETCQ